MLVFSPGAFAQSTTPTWDTSGNGLLNGSYYVREVFWAPADTSGDLADGASVYGVIAFDGNGNYTFNGQLAEAGQALSAQTFSGKYSISSSGYGFLDDLGIVDEQLFVLVSKGIFVGSPTENQQGSGYNMMVIGAPIGSPAATNATLTGSYTMVDFDAPLLAGVDTRNSLFTFTSDGAGNLTGTTAGTGFVAANLPTATRQNLTGVKYAFSNGAGNIFFPGSLTQSNFSTNLIAGNHYVYITPDGNFIFGGSPNGWDMLVGVRNGTGSPTAFGGLYYQAGMDQDFSSSSISLDSYFGSFNALSTGTILNHQRFDSLFDSGTFDFTFKDGFTFNTDGSTDDAVTVQHYIYGSNGAYRIGMGNSTTLGVNVAVAAPSLTGSDVFLNPTVIENASSFMPFTAQVSPGELLLLFGTGLPGTSASNPFFPTTLNNVQVLVDGVAAPIYYVLSSGLIAIQVPYETAVGVATIQVVSSSVKSNVVTVFVGPTQPGLFTQTADGIGYVAAQHFPSFQLVTPNNPAVAGETLVIYVDGLGTVTPTLADGTPANGSYKTTNTIQAFIGGTAATVGFSGLVPGTISLYQLNITVPSGLTPGDHILEIVGENASGAIDSDNFESKLSIGTSSTVQTVQQPQSVMVRSGSAVRPLAHGQPRFFGHARLGRTQP